MSDLTVIKGEYIDIEELPIGCTITDKVSNQTVVIGSAVDIDLAIKSLQKLKGEWYGD